MPAEKKYASSKPPKPKLPTAGQRTITELFFPKDITKNSVQTTVESAADDQNSESRKTGETKPAIILDEPCSSTPTPPSISIKDNLTHRAAKLPQKLFPIFDRLPLSRLLPVHEDDNVVEISDVPTASSPGILLKATSRASITLDYAESQLVSTNTGSSRDDPIVLESTPIKDFLQTERKPAPQVTAPMLPIGEQEQKSFPKSHPSHRAISTPYPSGETQHTRGPQSAFTSPTPHLQRRTGSTEEMSMAGADSLCDAAYFSFDFSEASLPDTATPNISNLESIEEQSVIDNIPTSFRAHPAISRLQEMGTQLISTSITFQQKMWADKWRPTRAEQVLGNEQNAIYLREWLRTLALYSEGQAKPPAPVNARSNDFTKVRVGGNGNKRPRVIRAVEKNKGRKRLRRDSDDEDQWIVDDDASSDVDRSDADEPTPATPLLSFDEVHRSEYQGLPPTQMTNSLREGNLTNTILLVGPSGCGKTAAVYACAEELDWEVFEVYPGIGKRNPASLGHLIGDVGKNHLVRKGQVNHVFQASPRFPFPCLSPTTDSKRNGQTSLDDGEELQERRSPASETDTVTVCESSTQETVTTTSSPDKIRQSMVLLEEVDILFKEDAGFWPAVVNLIKDCKRPVVMTCSDIALIPTNDLPLQTVLVFNPCPPPLAMSYLQCVCLAEGYFVNHDDLHGLYYSTNDVDAFDASIGLNNMTSLKPDLRRAINHLQFWCLHFETSRHRTRFINHDDDGRRDAEMINWNIFRVGKRSPQLCRQVLQHVELASFVDGEMPDYFSEIMEILNDDGPSTDDEIGHTILFPSSCTLPHMIGSHCKERTIVDGTMQSSRGTVEHLTGQERGFVPSSTFTGHQVVDSRVVYRSQMLEAFVGSSAPHRPHLPRTPFVLDYEPWLRYMVRIDDIYERNRDMVMGRRRRVTRSNQGHYERYLNLPTEQLEILRATRFGDPG